MDFQYLLAGIVKVVYYAIFKLASTFKNKGLQPRFYPFASLCPHLVKREANSVHFAALLKAVSQFPHQVPLE